MATRKPQTLTIHATVPPVEEPTVATTIEVAQQQIEAAANATAESVHPSTGNVETLDPIDEAAMLVERLNALRERAHEQTLKSVHALLAKLATLGFQYELVEASSVPVKRSAPAVRKTVEGESANFNAERECQYCKMVGHDGRLHRGQAQKRKFTPTELAQLGVVIPAGF